MDARVASDVLAISGETLAGKGPSGAHDLTRTWDRPYVTTNWPSGRPLSYDYSCDRDISTVPSSLTDSLEIYNREFLYQDGSSTFDIYGTVHPMSLPLSPTANQDDPEWPMFLSTSLSTSLDPLRLPDFQPATRDLLFGPEPATDPTSTSTMSDGPASRSVPTYRDTTEPLSDTIDSLPFSPSLSQTTAQTSMSRLSGSPYRNGAGQDCFLLPEANPSSAERTMSASEKYASLLGITPPSPGFGAGRASIASFSISTSAFRPADLANVPTSKAGRGLSGWSGDHGAAISAPPLGPRTSAQHKTRLNPSPVLSYSNFKVETASSTLAGREISGEAGEPERPKRRKSTLGRPLAYDLGSDEEDGGDDNDSDDYCPSRSPSVEPSFPNIASQFMTDIKPQLSPLVKPKSRRGKGKARGSAALALAVVTQLGARSREGSEVFEDLDLLLTSRDGKPGVRKRKNHPIPLPVPVPNLNKKSRGRKVPFVDCSVSSASLAGSQSSESGQGSNSPGADDSSGSGRPRRKTSRMPTPVSEDIAGSRTYVCVVAGCGKCFVRGEHLKRHVRSIHTYDKPHPCPYEGCDKTFSRRDNLGQHVRIHLQP